MTEAIWTDYGSCPTKYVRSGAEQRARDELAAFYRRARAADPAMAHLIYRRVQAASKAFNDHLWCGTGLDFTGADLSK